MTKNAIVEHEDFHALSPSTEGFPLTDVIKANFGAQGIASKNLDRIKIPAGGATTWEFETVKGTESSKNITGIIVAARDIRSWYDVPYEESNDQPPACYSPDGLIGYPRDEDIATAHGVGGPCVSCAKSKWGSDPKSGGQECDKKKLMLLLTPEKALPTVIVGPPGSLSNIESYFGRLTTEGLPHFAVVSSLELEQKTNPRNVKYAAIKPRFIRKLDEDEINSLLEYQKAIMPAFEQMSEVDAAQQAEATDVPYT